MAIAALTALGAALLYAVASVLQHHAASAQPAHHSLRPALLLRLVARPLWLLGIAVDFSAYSLQFVALSYGSLVLVQPLLVTGLLFALPLGAVVRHHGMTRSEWFGALAVALGVAVFLVVASPAKGKPDPSGVAWVGLFVIILGLAGALVVAAGRHPARRTMYLAGSTGMFYGLTAALTKSTAHLMSSGIFRALTQWQPYALLAVALVSLLVGQSAFHSGPLRSSLPVLAVVDPIASIVIGALAFGETVDTSGLAPVIEVAALGAMVAGVLVLGRSDLVVGDGAQRTAAHPAG